MPAARVSIGWPRRPRPTRVHRRAWQPKVRLLCPCCGDYITDWPEFAVAYRAWRFGCAGDDVFMRCAAVKGRYKWVPFPNVESSGWDGRTRCERESVERERRWQGGA